MSAELQYKDANAFIELILKALTIEDGKDDIPFVCKKITEEEKVKEKETIADEAFPALLKK